MNKHFSLTLLAAASLGLPAFAMQTHDSDRDGLPDELEIHKYRTDPKKADSDGDGIPDGDWFERREYQYTVRSIVRVMRPVTPEFLSDDYQDARVLDRTEHYVELEVVHYPFADGPKIEADPRWRRTASKMKEWTEPGPTNDWTPQLRKKLVAALRKDGIDVQKLDDKTLVERVSRWLCERAKSEAGFTIFTTAFDDDGKPFVPPEFATSVEKNERSTGRKRTEQWKREVSASGMFDECVRGTCSSSSIYLNGCLRALGIPTRTILCIPVVDAGDANERAMLEGLRHNRVRSVLVAAIQDLETSWASHTFNEVFVGGRWVRLNYDRLGQGIFDGALYGMLTHVATCSDWADFRFWDTIGRRQKVSRPEDDPFGGNNPYSTIALRDEFGPHCSIENPSGPTARITRVSRSADPALPQDIREWFERRKKVGLIVETDATSPRGSEMKSFLESVDRTLELVTSDDTRFTVSIERGIWWNSGGHLAVLFDEATARALEGARVISVACPNATDNAKWTVPPKLSVDR
ncbi:MAG: hypothetical protein KDC95_01985 [Planctomycetes bacterium]|nr:hypothetical protein [Planctomycetota bacterium]